MDTTVQAQIDRIKQNIASAYEKVYEKGVALPEVQNSENLPTAIERIQAGGGLPEGLHTITLEADPSEGGSVSGGGVASAGMTVTVKAEAADRYTFKGWRENGYQVSSDTEYTFPVDQDRKLVAAMDNAPSRLPEGYTEVEYISNGAKSSTNYRPFFKMPNTTSAVKMEIKFLIGTKGISTTYQSIFGYISGSNYHILTTYNGTIAYVNGANTTRKELGSYDADTQYTVTLDYPNKTITMNGNTISESTGTAWRTSANYMFTDGSWSPINLHIYSIKMWDANDEIVREFVPCINPSGVVGMYETVGEEFYTKQNSLSTAEEFTPGPAV